MPEFTILYDDRILAHLAENGVTIEDFQAIANHPSSTESSRSTGRIIAFGLAEDGRYLACIYEEIDDLTILPFTAYEVEP